MSDHIVRVSSNSNIVRTSPDSDPRATSLGTVAPRRFDQLIDVNMTGVADKDLVTYDEATKTYIPTSRVNFFPDEINLLYVAKNGNDENSGKSIQEAKLTIEAAIAIATANTVIRVSPGTYVLNNPVTVPDQVSIIGSSLREVSIACANPGDLFYIGNGNYFAEMSFTGTENPGAAIFSFDPVQVRYINQSPYIQNCTNFIPKSIGMKVNGRYAIGPLKSMVLDSYTQYNQGGIGVSITNSGYAQLVSLFTICDEIAVFCGSGGACDLTNSNSSFGTFGLVADGLSPLQYTGITTSATGVNADTFEIQFNNPTYNITNATYDNYTGILTAYTSQPHQFSVGMGISLAGLAFTCPSGPGIVTYPSGNKGYVFQALTVAPGRYVDAYDSIQANKREIQDKALAAVAIAYPDFFFEGDSQTNARSRYYDAYRLIQNNKNVIVNAAWSDTATAYPEVNSTESKCKRDLGYFIDAISTDVFTGGNRYAREFVRQYFDASGSPIANGLVGEEIPSVYAFNAARNLMKAAITNTLVGADYTDLTLTPDPLTGSNTSSSSCADVQTNIDNLVSIVTTVISQGSLSSISSDDNYGVLNAGGSKCLRDIGFIIDAVSLDVRDFTSHNTIEAVKAYFNLSGNLLFNGLQGEVQESIVAFNAARDLMKAAITNQLNQKNLNLIADPLTGSNTSPSSCADVQSFIDNLVGILTSRISAGNINGVNDLPVVSAASTVFSCYVGISTLSHTYVSGGTAKLNIVRPFDGQAIYFDRQYYTVNKLKIVNGGSGYTSTPTITIDPPETSWGIRAQAIPTVRNGTITEIDLISSGRGYTSLPRISISSPNVGINTAIASLEIFPTYHSIQRSTPISSSGICTITIADNVPYTVGVGTNVYFFKQSRVLATGHSLEYIGSGTKIETALPAAGGVPIQENETDARNGGLVVFTSTDQSGNFRIGDGVVINQQTGNISGQSYSKSLFSQMTPYILALGGD